MSRHRQDMRRLGKAGFTTASSIQGGVFGSAPEAQARDRLDGRAGGRGNSSSVAGGIFGEDPVMPVANTGKQTQMQRNPFEGAAGSKGNNNAQILNGHFRANIGGEQTAKDHLANNNSQLLNGHYRGGTVKRTGGDDFLSKLSGAEERDDVYLAEMRKAAEDHETIMAAVAQISAEQGVLSPQEMENLYYSLQARLREKAAQEPQQLATGGGDWEEQAESFIPPPVSDCSVTGNRFSTKVHAPPGGHSSIVFG